MGGLLSTSIQFGAKPNAQGDPTITLDVTCTIDNFVYPSTRDDFNPSIDTYNDFRVVVNDATFNDIQETFRDIPLTELTIKSDQVEIEIQHKFSFLLNVETSFATATFLFRVERYSSTITATLKEPSNPPVDDFPMECHINPTPSNEDRTVFQTSYQIRVSRSTYDRFRTHFINQQLGNIGFTDIVNSGFPVNAPVKGFLIESLLATNIYGIFTVTIIRIGEPTDPVETVSSILYPNIIKIAAYVVLPRSTGGTNIYVITRSLSVRGLVNNIAENESLTNLDSGTITYKGFKADIRIPISEINRIKSEELIFNRPGSTSRTFPLVNLRSRITDALGIPISDMIAYSSNTGENVYGGFGVLFKDFNWINPSNAVWGNVFMLIDRDDIDPLKFNRSELRQTFGAYTDHSKSEIVFNTVISTLFNKYDELGR